MEWIKRKPTEKNVKLSFLAHRRLLKKYLSMNSFSNGKKYYDYINSKRSYHAMMCDEIIRTNKKVSTSRKREIYNIAFDRN